VPIEMLKNQRFLEPEETAVLSEVFDDVVKRLRIVDRQDVLTTLIARKLVELARAGERDPRRLKQKNSESFRGDKPDRSVHLLVLNGDLVITFATARACRQSRRRCWWSDSHCAVA
jgi:hypothetical protein